MTEDEKLAYNKLQLSASIVNADINSSASIAYSKLASAMASSIVDEINSPGVLTSILSQKECDRCATTGKVINGKYGNLCLSCSCEFDYELLIDRRGAVTATRKKNG